MGTEEMRDRCLHREDSPRQGKDNSLQYSCLENPTDRGAWWATAHGVAKSRTRLSNYHFPWGSMVKTALPLQGPGVRSLVRGSSACLTVQPKRKK